jgi:hypothetical protein
MRPKPCLLVLATVPALFGWTSAVAAQRSFVATTGTDNPNCSAQAPCRTFDAAIAAVAPGGEVVVLDSGGYGPATIGKSVSMIAAPGVYAGVSVFSGDGVTIDGSGIAVVLRGLMINGLGGTNGITISNAATVRVDNCVVSNFGGAGIFHTSGTLYVEDTTVHDNAGIGIWSIGPVQANLHRVRMEQNLDGIRVQDGANGAVYDSVMIRNAHVGAFAFVSAGASARLLVSRSLMSYNQQGGQARSISNGAIAQLTVTDSTVTENNPDGLLTTQNNGGLAWLVVTRTTSRNNFSEDLDVSASTTAWLDSSSMNELFVPAGATLYTRDNNDVFIPLASGTVLHEAAF